MPTQGALVMVVDDEPPIRRLIHRALEQEGYRVAEAETGRQAIRLAAQQPPAQTERVGVDASKQVSLSLEEAIRLALNWLDGRTSPGPPPPTVSPHFEVAIRQSLLAQRGLALSPIYLEAARENGTLLD